MAFWLRKGGGFVYVETIVAKSYTKCRSFAQRETPELERNGSEPVRVSTLDERQCCKFMPLTFPAKPSMRTKGRKFRNSAPPSLSSSDSDGDTADWISKVVNDPLVEIDPVTMSQHLLAAQKNEGLPVTRTKTNTPGRTSSVLVSTCRQPFTYFSPPPQGFGRVVAAVGATVLLVSLASAMHLLRARRQLEKVVNYDSSSDEENKLDLLSLVEDQEEQQGEEEEEDTLSKQKVVVEEEINLQNVSPEVVYAAAVAALAQSDEFQRAFAQQHQAKMSVPVHAEHTVPEFLFRQPPRVNPPSIDDLGLVPRLDTEKQEPEVKAGDLTAPFMHSNPDDELPSPADTLKDLNKTKEFLRGLEVLCLTTFVFVFLGVPGTEQEALAGNGFTGSAKENELTKVVQAAVPAVALGAGAVSMITGVDGALEMVGLAATASFIYYDLLWAESRKELCHEFRKIKDHKKLTEFLKSKKIVQSDL